MKIQTTTIVEAGPDMVQIDLMIADNEDIEQATQYVVCSVLVSTEAKGGIHDPIAFRILQTRALKQAVALLDQADDAMRSQQP